MKKKKRKFKKEFHFGIFWGTKGLKISLICMLVVNFFLIVFLYTMYDSLPRIGRIMVDSSFNGRDYLAIFAGVILFIIVPFLVGIRVGMSLKKPVK